MNTQTYRHKKTDRHKQTDRKNDRQTEEKTTDKSGTNEKCKQQIVSECFTKKFRLFVLLPQAHLLS